MNKIVAANFKANHTSASAKAYLEELDNLLSPKDRVYVFPNMASLCHNTFKNITIGSQNAYPVMNGAFTGEIGLEVLKDFGIHSILIGHSERRNILGESQRDCAQKFEFFAQEGFEIIYCVGESLDIRKLGLFAVENFISSEFKDICTSYERLIIAYEPIWAIGSGVSATLEQIKQTHQMIKELAPVSLLYGGSVKASNAKDIFEIDEVDGVLVGGASLVVEDFYEIIKGGRE